MTALTQRTEKTLARIKTSLARITAQFNDTPFLRLDRITLLFNPTEVKTGYRPPGLQPDEYSETSEFQPTKPRFKWGAAKLSKVAEEKLRWFIYEVQNSQDLTQNRLFDEFPETALFLALEGPSGTGKTTLANAVADRLGVPIIEISYGAIENSLVGEAAKTLKRVFAVAKKTGALLFIDEADSLASHRPTKSQSGI